MADKECMKGMILIFFFSLIIPIFGESEECIKEFQELTHFIDTESINSNWDLLETAIVQQKVELSTEYKSPDGEKTLTYFSYETQRELPKIRRNYFNKLRDLSRHRNGSEREYGGFIVEFEDGQSKAISFTSNELREITQDAWIKALTNSELDIPAGHHPQNPVTKVIHIHTHPWLPDANTMLPSDIDVSTYKDILNYYGHDIDFEAYILPLCDLDFCDDILIKVDKSQVIRSIVP